LSVKQLGSGWDSELLTVSSGSKLFAYGTIVVLCGLGVNLISKESLKADIILSLHWLQDILKLFLALMPALHFKRLRDLEVLIKNL